MPVPAPRRQRDAFHRHELGRRDGASCERGERDDERLIRLVEQRTISLLREVEVPVALTGAKYRHAEKRAHGGVAGREPARRWMRGKVIETDGTIGDDHFTEQTSTPREMADRLDGRLVHPVVDEGGQLPSVVVDTEGGVAGIRNRSGPLHDALQDRVAVMRAGQLQGCSKQDPHPVRPLPRHHGVDVRARHGTSGLRE